MGSVLTPEVSNLSGGIASAALYGNAVEGHLYKSATAKENGELRSGEQCIDLGVGIGVGYCYVHWTSSFVRGWDTESY